MEDIDLTEATTPLTTDSPADRAPLRFAQRVHEMFGGLRSPPMALG